MGLTAAGKQATNRTREAGDYLEVHEYRVPVVSL